MYIALTGRFTLVLLWLCLPNASLLQQTLPPHPIYRQQLPRRWDQVLAMPFANLGWWSGLHVPHSLLQAIADFCTWQVGPCPAPCPPHLLPLTVVVGGLALL